MKYNMENEAPHYARLVKLLSELRSQRLERPTEDVKYRDHGPIMRWEIPPEWEEAGRWLANCVMPARLISQEKQNQYAHLEYLFWRVRYLFAAIGERRLSPCCQRAWQAALAARIDAAMAAVYEQ